MNHFPTIIAVALATVTASLFGLVLIPDWQMDDIDPVEAIAPDGSTVVYPRPLEKWREQPGRESYQRYGCIYCHSQQVRPEGFGADIERGWGMRRSVPRDYILQTPPFTGSMRTGPDLANIAARQPSRDWHLLHLYDPTITSPGSIMPSFKFLFSKKTGSGSPSLEAIRLPGESDEETQWLVPSEEALQLVAYLLTLNQELSMEEVR